MSQNPNVALQTRCEPWPAVSDIAQRVTAGTTPANEPVARALANIEAHNPDVGALLHTFTPEQLREAQIQGKPEGPLAGVPIALKSNICSTLAPTSCSSRFLQSYTSPFDATVVRKLRDAGATIVGIADMDEFAMGSSCEHSALGSCKNPFDTTRVPGGSSGGSAAAVGAGMVPVALGSDTGGSIRQPAAFCGAVGLKPTYGRVSRYGLVAFASSLDQIGPITPTIDDAALVLSVIAGHDPLDSTSADVPIPAELATGIGEPDATRLRIGVAKQGKDDANAPAVNHALEQAIQAYENAGAQIVEIDLPHLKYSVAAYYIVAPAEASSNLARFDGVRYGQRADLEDQEGLLDLYEKSRSEGFGEEVQRRIMLGTYVLSSGYYDAYYLKALKARRLIKGDFDAAFDAGGPHVDAVLMPTTPHPAFTIGAHSGDPLTMYLEDIYTVAANMAGLPAVSVPFGAAQEESANGPVTLPLGMQLVGKSFDEVGLLRAAKVLEHANT